MPQLSGAHTNYRERRTASHVVTEPSLRLDVATALWSVANFTVPQLPEAYTTAGERANILRHSSPERTGQTPTGGVLPLELHQSHGRSTIL